MEAHWPKHCGCGAVWTREAWSRLPYLARWELEGGPTHELRHCHCGTTLAVDVSLLGGAAPGTCAADSDLLAHLLVEKKQDLLDRWTRRVLDGRRGDGAGGEPELRHDIALFIDDLIATLLDDGVDSRRLRQLTREPARAERVTIVNRTLRATLGEWADFRAALIDLCDHAAVVLDAGRMRLVHRAID
ncbi:hypothetical protein BH11MYX4_BH11MYX4_64090 [soil metagenome]